MKLSRVIKAVRNPKKVVFSLLHELSSLRIRRVIKDGAVYHRFKGQLYPDYLNRGNAQLFISERAKVFCFGIGIDVGAGRWPFDQAIPVRDEPEQNAYKLDAFKDASLDYVFSSHCLEHLDRWYDALELWVRKLKDGGVLFLYLPHESMELWRRWQPWGWIGHKWQPNHQILIPFLKGSGLEIVEFNPGKDDYWSFHIVAKKTTQSPIMAESRSHYSII